MLKTLLLSGQSLLHVVSTLLFTSLVTFGPPLIKPGLIASLAAFFFRLIHNALELFGTQPRAVPFVFYILDFFIALALFLLGTQFGFSLRTRQNPAFFSMDRRQNPGFAVLE